MADGWKLQVFKPRSVVESFIDAEGLYPGSDAMA